jgi:hypothetical protein
MTIHLAEPYREPMPSTLELAIPDDTMRVLRANASVLGVTVTHMAETILAAWARDQRAASRALSELDMGHEPPEDMPAFLRRKG